MPDFVKYDKNGKYEGLTDYAKKLLESSRNSLRIRKALFKKEFKQFDTVYHAAHVNRLMKGNMFFYGPPGGAKSKCIKWILAQDKDKAFEIQMHQMMSEQAFIGGHNFNAAQEGRFEINTEGSLADFKVALIDEIDKGNPAALAALLSLLNERQVLTGNKVIESTLEAIFSTSNTNLYEFYQQFAENGLRSTASALLNRFTTVAFIPNWISRIDQALLDYNYLNKLDDDFKPCTDKTEQLSSTEINWQDLRTLAYYILRPNEEFLSISREFNDMLRNKTLQDIQADQIDTEYPYYPTVDYTERLREKIHAVVIMSAFLDLLDSPLVDDINALENTLKNLTHHRLPIGPFSLWRAYLSLTTVSFGKVNLLMPENNPVAYINFGNFFESYHPKDKQEKHTIQYILQEQEQFKDIFTRLIKEHQETLEESASYQSLSSCNSTLQEIQDIEMLLIQTSE